MTGLFPEPSRPAMVFDGYELASFSENFTRQGCLAIRAQRDDIKTRSLFAGNLFFLR